MKWKQKCTMCGKRFEIHDTYANLSFEKQVGYGSVHDGEFFKLDLCCSCFDRLTDLLNAVCKRNIFTTMKSASKIQPFR